MSDFDPTRTFPANGGNWHDGLQQGENRGKYESGMDRRRSRLLFGGVPDPGSGICLWSANHGARERFGYPVDHWTLSLSENTKRWLSYLIAWFDTSIDWSSPSDSDDQWSAEEVARFREASERGLALVCEELGSRFVVPDKWIGRVHFRPMANLLQRRLHDCQ